MDNAIKVLHGIPGPAWVALVEAMIGWLNGTWFVGEQWAVIAVVVLSGVLQLLKFYLERSAARKYRRVVTPESKAGVAYRFLFGG